MLCYFLHMLSFKFLVFSHSCYAIIVQVHSLEWRFDNPPEWVDCVHVVLRPLSNVEELILNPDICF